MQLFQNSNMTDSKPILPEGTSIKRTIIIPKHRKRSKKKDKYTPHGFEDARADFDFMFDEKFGKFIIKTCDSKMSTCQN